jgi:choline dehydrogenase-like flavoprotein
MKTEYGPVEGTTLEDWPIDYEELEPYFEKAEYELGVAGEGGVNPFEGQRNKPFPCPPVEPQPGDQRVRDAAKRLGYHPFVPSLGLVTKRYRGRTPCWRHPCCNGFVCEIGAKSTPVTALLPDALASGNCQIVPDAVVKEITLDSRGRVDGVSYFDRGGQL